MICRKRILISTSTGFLNRFYSSVIKKPVNPVAGSSSSLSQQSTTAASTNSSSLKELPENPIPTQPRPRQNYDPSQIDLTLPLVGVENGIYLKYDNKTSPFQQTKITKLDNGLRIVTQPRFGNFSTVGIAIGAGSRHERNFTHGVTNFIEKLGFSPSVEFPDHVSIVRALEEYGGLCDCQYSRDTSVYAVSAERRGLEKVVQLLYHSVFKPLIKDETVEHIRQSIAFEQEDLEMRPEQDLRMTDLLHEAAWGKETLGIPRLCPLDTISSIKRSELLQFMRTYYVPENIVVTGIGIEHEELVHMIKHYFNFNDTTWTNEKYEGKDPIIPMDKTSAVYKGGVVKVEKDFGRFNTGPLPVPTLAYLGFGLQSVNHQHPDFIATCVLNILMGGGGSFSAGGPGKGMYSRLYRNVLNQYGWANHCSAFNTSYHDSGIFAIYGSTPPVYLKNLLTVIIKQLAAVIVGIDDEELSRAKTQLQSMLLMNLESRVIVFEDVGRQMLANGSYKQPDQYIDDIEKVKREDIERLTGNMFQSKFSVAALGNVSQLPNSEEIQSIIENVLNQQKNGNRRTSLKWY